MNFQTEQLISDMQRWRVNSELGFHARETAIRTLECSLSDESPQPPPQSSSICRMTAYKQLPPPVPPRSSSLVRIAFYKHLNSMPAKAPPMSRNSAWRENGEARPLSPIPEEISNGVRPLVSKTMVRLSPPTANSDNTRLEVTSQDPDSVHAETKFVQPPNYVVPSAYSSTASACFSTPDLQHEFQTVTIGTDVRRQYYAKDQPSEQNDDIGASQPDLLPDREPALESPTPPPPATTAAELQSERRTEPADAYPPGQRLPQLFEVAPPRIDPLLLAISLAAHCFCAVVRATLEAYWTLTLPATTSSSSSDAAVASPADSELDQPSDARQNYGTPPAPVLILDSANFIRAKLANCFPMLVAEHPSARELCLISMLRSSHCVAPTNEQLFPFDPGIKSNVASCLLVAFA